VSLVYQAFFYAFLRLVKSGIGRRYKYKRNPQRKTITPPVSFVFAPSPIQLLTSLLGFTAGEKRHMPSLQIQTKSST
jgi:hypothetical protein